MLRQLTLKDEAMLRRWIIPYDLELGVHRQLRDYFLQETPNFGSCGWFENNLMVGVGLWSRAPDKSFIHRIFGDHIPLLEELRVWLDRPCQLYLTEDQEAAVTTPPWEVKLKVTAGMVNDHAAYQGVFARVAPRFKGTVYEHP
jgi:hypothetical protein